MAACSKARMPSAWLNPYDRRMPWSKYCCASGEVVLTV